MALLVSGAEVGQTMLKRGVEQFTFSGSGTQQQRRAATGDNCGPPQGVIGQSTWRDCVERIETSYCD